MIAKLRSALALAVFRRSKHDISIVRGGPGPLILEVWASKALLKFCSAATLPTLRMRPVKPITITPNPPNLNAYGKPFPRDSFELEWQMLEVRCAARARLGKLLDHSRLFTGLGIRLKALRIRAADIPDALLTGFVSIDGDGYHMYGIRIEIKK